HGVGAFHHGVAAGPVAADDLVLEQGQPGIGVDGGAGDPFGARQRCCFLPGAEVSPSPHTASRVRSTQANDWGSKSSGRIRHCRQAWATSSGWACTTRFLSSQTYSSNAWTSVSNTARCSEVTRHICTPGRPVEGSPHPYPVRKAERLRDLCRSSVRHCSPRTRVADMHCFRACGN